MLEIIDIEFIICLSISKSSTHNLIMTFHDVPDSDIELHWIP